MHHLIVVLAYHTIGRPSAHGWETWFQVSVRAFLHQLRDLARGGWQVIDANTFVRGLADPSRLPRRAALLTFDDGYRSFLGPARQSLSRLGYPAVLFVPAAFVGGRSEWNVDTEQPVEEICGWHELRELEGSGVSVQSHGLAHRELSALPPEEVERELVESKILLEQGLDKRIELFSYPYGDAGSGGLVREALARAGYRGAFLYEGGPQRMPPADPYRLARIAVGSDTDLPAELEP